VKYTNKYNAPAPWVRAVLNDPYDSGTDEHGRKSDFTASQISGWQPPRCYALLKTFEGSDQLAVDVCSRVATMIVNGVHSLAERAARPGIDICEVRYFADFEVDGKVYLVSAKIDLFEQDTGILWDWKTAKAGGYAKGRGKKADYISQLNIAREIMLRQKRPIEARELKIIGILKDWADYISDPPAPVIAVDLPIWEREKTLAFIKGQIRARVAALKELPLCTTKETLGGRKCGTYNCEANSVCTQYQEMLKTGLAHERAEGE
jgi:hypothetical protein